MLRHLATAALRNLNANRLQSAIAIIGLSIGIAAALLMALVVRNQTSFDHFIPDYARTYLAVSQFTPSKIVMPKMPAGFFGSVGFHVTADEGPANIAPFRGSIFNDNTAQNTAAMLKLNVPEVEGTTYLMPRQGLLRQGQVGANENIYWAAPNLFEVLPLPLLQGDPKTALRGPGDIVLSRAMARKYFGRDDVVGQAILLNDHPMRVAAVIADFPANGTSFTSGIFVSSLAPFSPGGDNGVMTYMRLKQGADITAVERQLPKLAEQINGRKDPAFSMLLVGLDQLQTSEFFHPGAKSKLAMEGMAGALVLFIAIINFVNLLTARAARRALEVGVRKVCGAARRLLMLQFLGESILTVFFATCVAVALGEWLLPQVNAFLQSGAKLDYWQNPVMLGVLLSGVVVLGLLAGAYPAFVLSSFRPSGALKGALQHSPGADLIRNGLVVLQFAVLIGLVVATTVIYQQNLFATREGLRADIDQMLVMRGACQSAFRDELRKLPGVVGASCAGTTFEGFDTSYTSSRNYNGQIIETNNVRLDLGNFALYGVKPLAGSLPSASSGGDYDPNAAPGIVINEAAAKRFGFASPQAALGQKIGERIIAVVPDFSFQPLADKPIAPTFYSAGPLGSRVRGAVVWARAGGPPPLPEGLVSIKLKGQQIPETMAAIDRVWRATNPGFPVDRYFLNEYMQQLYVGMLRQAQLFAVFSGIAIFLACLGLLGLSISTAERRTKEIGVRKAMGASSSDVTRLLLWQFTKPVLWANLIAWPVAFFAMNKWLSSYAYHVALSPLFFIGATLLAVMVALFTVAVQSMLVARAVPATALRYE